ncbi:MAG TPA: ABC transporter permease [Bauldia sp.]|nr:ABC transporter permease [Bauldia sp.]
MNGRALLRRLAGLLYGAVLIAIFAFLTAPVFVVTTISFSNESFISFPPARWGWRAYEQLLKDETWLQPLLRSLELATSVGVLSTIIGVIAVLGIRRTRLRGAALWEFVGLGPLVAPGVAYAVALYAFYSSIHLLGTFLGIVLAHTVLALPFVLLIVGAAMTRVPRQLELAAQSLGAGRIEAWLQITLPMLAPAVIASFVFSFITSFDEAVVANFVGDIGFVTLPVQMFDSVRFGVEPVIAAVSTSLLAFTALFGLLYGYARGRA